MVPVQEAFNSLLQCGMKYSSIVDIVNAFQHDSNGFSRNLNALKDVSPEGLSDLALLNGKVPQYNILLR